MTQKIPEHNSWTQHWIKAFAHGRSCRKWRNFFSGDIKDLAITSKSCKTQKMMTMKFQTRFVCLFVTFYPHFLEWWFRLSVCYILSSLFQVECLPSWAPLNKVEKSPNAPTQSWFRPHGQHFPSNDYYDDDETLKASVLQAGSLSSSVPPLSGIRHRPGDNQNVDYLGYLDYLVYLDHLGNNQNVDYLGYEDYLVYLDHLGSVVLVKGVREVMVVRVLIMMVPLLVALMRMMLTVMKKKMIVTLYNWEGKDDLSNEPCQIFWTPPSTIPSWFHQSAAYSSSKENLSFFEQSRILWMQNGLFKK